MTPVETAVQSCMGWMGCAMSNLQKLHLNYQVPDSVDNIRIVVRTGSPDGMTIYGTFPSEAGHIPQFIRCDDGCKDGVFDLGGLIFYAVLDRKTQTSVRESCRGKDRLKRSCLGRLEVDISVSYKPDTKT